MTVEFQCGAGQMDSFKISCGLALYGKATASFPWVTTWVTNVTRMSLFRSEVVLWMLKSLHSICLGMDLIAPPKALSSDGTQNTKSPFVRYPTFDPYLSRDFISTQYTLT
jgi:hypothetical protein